MLARCLPERATMCGAVQVEGQRHELGCLDIRTCKAILPGTKCAHPHRTPRRGGADLTLFGCPYSCTISWYPQANPNYCFGIECEGRQVWANRCLRAEWGQAFVERRLSFVVCLFLVVPLYGHQG